MMCDWGDSNGPYVCIECGITKTKPVKRQCGKTKPAYERPEIERLEIITEHCSNCDKFTDAPTFKGLKCSRIASCQCLWKKAANRLFKCPAGKFQCGQDIIKEYNDPTTPISPRT